MLWRILKYVQHQFYWKHRKGRGIHSPYLFEFIHDVVFNGASTRTPGELTNVHRELHNDVTMIPADTMGARSRFDRAGEHTVGSFVRRSSVSERVGSLLFRITRWSRPDMILELGTGLGVSALYLASGHPEVPLHSFEGNTERAAFAAQLFCRSHLERISIHWGDLDQKLDDFLPQMEGKIVSFVDANHRYDPTIRYVKVLVEKAGDESVIIMDDIYWSKGMFKAWKEVISWPEVRISIDLFHMGILLLRKDLQKSNVKINF